MKCPKKSISIGYLCYIYFLWVWTHFSVLIKMKSTGWCKGQSVKVLNLILQTHVAGAMILTIVLWPRNTHTHTHTTPKSKQNNNNNKIHWLASWTQIHQHMELISQGFYAMDHGILLIYHLYSCIHECHRTPFIWKKIRQDHRATNSLHSPIKWFSTCSLRPFGGWKILSQWAVYQISCISDINIMINNSTKVRVMK